MSDDFELKYKGSIDAFERLTGRTKSAEVTQPQQNDIAQIAAAFIQYQQYQQQHLEVLRAQVRSLPTPPQLPPPPPAQAQLPPAQPEFVMPTTAEYVTQPVRAGQPPTQPRAITVEAIAEVLPPPPPPPTASEPVTAQVQQIPEPAPNPLASWFRWSLTQPGIVALYLALIMFAGFSVARHAPIVNHWLTINQKPAATVKVKPAKAPAKPTPKQP